MFKTHTNKIREIFDKLSNYMKDKIDSLLKEVDELLNNYRNVIEGSIENEIKKFTNGMEIPMEKISSIKNSFINTLKFDIILHALYRISVEKHGIKYLDIAILNYVLEYLRTILISTLSVEPRLSKKILDAYVTLFELKRDLIIRTELEDLKKQKQVNSEIPYHI